ncbi:MAG: hypothetical protein L0H94_00310 [Nitrospira sp.]|nr:hypothetical protein [Nitrospira sp.]
MAATLNHWQEKNDEFLQAAVAWLRLKLLRLAAYGLNSSTFATQAVWREAMGTEAKEVASLVAGQFHLEAGKIHRLARQAIPPPPRLVFDDNQKVTIS